MPKKKGLRDGRWNDQHKSAREFYSGVSNDDILQGFRAEGGLTASGKPLGIWRERNSDTIFSQWLSRMSRRYRATDDSAMRDKASHLDDVPVVL